MEQNLYRKVIKLPQGMNYYLPSMRERKSAVFLKREIFKKGRYDHPGFKIQETDTVVDIGANMGFFSIWAAQKAQKGKIFALEPVKESFDLMQLNIKKNGIRNIQPVQAAVGIEGKCLEIVKYPGFNAINHLNGNTPTIVTKLLVGFLTSQGLRRRVIEKISTISLDHIIEENKIDRIDYLKLDCEGGEFNILRTLSDKGFAKICKIAMEFHEFKLGDRYQELVDILKSKGFEVEVEKSPLSYLAAKCGFIWARRKNR